MKRTQRLSPYNLTLPAAADGLPRSPISRVYTARVEKPGRPVVTETLESFPDTEEGRAAVIAVACQMGPKWIAGVSKMIDRIEEERLEAERRFGRNSS